MCSVSSGSALEDKILLNFDRTAGLFHSILYTKLFSVLLLALSCLGTKGVKGEKITWGRIWTAFAVGFVLFFLNWWLLPLPLPLEAVTGLYVLTIGTGYVCLLMGGLWMSRRTHSPMRCRRRHFTAYATCPRMTRAWNNTCGEKPSRGTGKRAGQQLPQTDLSWDGANARAAS